ncbi:MAG: type IV toxin-antitoxin system AbiEi family antitoxin [Candidatus Hadarchaeales archaeon]
MYKLQKLSGLEQKLYFLLEAEDKRVVDAEIAMRLLNISKMHAYNLLKKMCKKGALDKVKSNLYVRVPAHLVHDKGKYTEDPILVAKHLVEPYFFSHSTALMLHGLAQQPGRNYFISTTKHVSKVEYRGNLIRPVILTKKRFFGFEKKEYSKEEVMVSDLERTIVDVIDRPEYAGGYEEVLRCLSDVEEINWDRLLAYIKKMDEKILVNRIGYVAELLKMRAPAHFIKALREMMSKNIYYFERKKAGKFNKRWRIIVDPRLEGVAQGT